MVVATRSWYDDFLGYCKAELGGIDYTIQRKGLGREIKDLSVFANVSGVNFLGGSGSSTPYELNNHLAELARTSSKFKGNDIYSISTVGDLAYVRPELKEKIMHNAFFVGGNIRDAVRDRYAVYRQSNLSDIPNKFDNGEIPLHAVFLRVAPARNGYYSMGINNDVQTSAARNAQYLVVQVDPTIPFTVGPGTLIPEDSVDYYLHAPSELHAEEQGTPNELSDVIARNVMDYIEDQRGGLSGRTYQFGIGGVPNAIAARLIDYENLGVWSEMISDGVKQLMEGDNPPVNNSQRNMFRGKTVTSFGLGSRDFYSWLDGNEDVVFVPTEVTNGSGLERIVNYTSINSALEVDYNGQFGSNSIHHPLNIYSGFGGAVDTMQGARRAKGGVSVIALPSTAKHDEVSRIVSRISGSVVGTNANSDVLATEHGVVCVKEMHDMGMMSLAIINRLAHPKFRQELMDQLTQDMPTLCTKKPLIAESDQRYRQLVRSEVTLA